MLRDNFFKMSMQKPLQHSFVYGSVWPTILKDKDTTKTENVKVLIVTNNMNMWRLLSLPWRLWFHLCLFVGWRMSLWFWFKKSCVFSYYIRWRFALYRVLFHCSSLGISSGGQCNVFLLCLFENWFLYIIGFCCSRLLSSHCYRWRH